MSGKLQLPPLAMSHAGNWAIIATLGIAAYVLLRGTRGAARDVVAGVGGVATGTIEGIGETIGIPVTNMTECERAIAEGRRWDASFACPAGTFLGWVFGATGPRQG